MAIRCCIAMAIFLMSWEAAARIDDAVAEGAPLFGRYDESTLMTNDAYGIAGRPGARYGKWRMNSLGYRGPEVRADRERVVCIGASETFGLYEPEGLEFPRQLERDLNALAGGERYQVVNAALPGQSAGSFARRARAVFAQLHPTVAVVYPSLAIYIDPPPENEIPRLRLSPVSLRITGKLARLFGDHVPAGIALHKAGLASLPEINVDRFRRDLSRLLDAMAVSQVRPLLVTHATRFGDHVEPADARYLTAWRALYPALRETGFPDMERRLNAVIRSEGARRRIAVVDAALWLHGADHFVEFVHFTPQGAGALAQAVATAIVKGGDFAQQAAQ